MRHITSGTTFLYFTFIFFKKEPSLRYTVWQGVTGHRMLESGAEIYLAENKGKCEGSVIVRSAATVLSIVVYWGHCDWSDGEVTIQRERSTSNRQQ